MDTSVQDIFARNLRKFKNSKGQEIAGLSTAFLKDTADIYYPSVHCLYHSQGNNLDGFAVKISNIIEFDAAGIITVHKYTAQKGAETVQKESRTLDFTTKESAKEIYVAMGGTAESFNDETYDTMKENIAVFTYLLYIANSNYDYDGNPEHHGLSRRRSG